MASHLQKNDDKVFRKKFGSQIEDTERSKKKTLEVFLPALSKNPFRTVPQQIKTTRTVEGDLITWTNRFVETKAKPHRTYSSTENFLSPILISDWLIFFYGSLILCQKGNENDKNNEEKEQKEEKKKKKKGVA